MKFGSNEFHQPFFIQIRINSRSSVYSFIIFKVTGDSNPILAKYTPLA